VNIELAQRLQQIPPYEFATIGKRIRELQVQGHKVIGLHMGSPDMPPPPAVVEALHRSAQQPTHHGYGGFSGTPALRQAFAGYYSRRFGVELNPDTEVLPLIGSKEGIFNASLAFLNEGDVALVPDPAYPTYEIGAMTAGAQAFHMPLREELGFLPDLDSIPSDVLKHARLMWINYPNNPTGAQATLAELAKIVDFCRDHSIVLCSDNPYADVVMEGDPAPSVLSVPGAKDVAVEFNSLSKTYNMAGWRVGACVGHPTFVAGLGRLKSNIDSGLFRSIQDAAVVAMTETSQEWIDQRNAVYRRRRDAIMQALPAVGLTAQTPRTAIYVWAKVPGGDDRAFAAAALEEAHVSLAPGSMYGEMGKGFVRFSLVLDEADIAEGMERLAAWQARS